MRAVFVLILTSILIGCGGEVTPSMSNPGMLDGTLKPNNRPYMSFTDEQVTISKQKCDVNGGVEYYVASGAREEGILYVQCNNGAKFDWPTRINK